MKRERTVWRFAQIDIKMFRELGADGIVTGCLKADGELNCEIKEYYSESDNRAFREYLKEKYKTLDALNEAWGTVCWNQTYSEWSQAYVPRTTINDKTNPHQTLDFTGFISESVIRYCKMQSDILWEYVKEGDFITTNRMFANLDNHKMQDTCLGVYTYDSFLHFGGIFTRENMKNFLEYAGIMEPFSNMVQASEECELPCEGKRVKSIYLY